MTRFTYRNRLGDVVDVPAVAASDAKNRFGAIVDQAATIGPVAITRHDTTRAVLLSIEEFESLTAERQSSLTRLSAEFDALLAKMQTPAAREGVAQAFAATPAELGKAAVRAAKPARQPHKGSRTRK
jgi:antitoxin Phd